MRIRILALCGLLAVALTASSTFCLAQDAEADGETRFMTVMQEMAQKLRGKGIKRIAILEFADNTGKTPQLGGAIGSGGKFFAEVAQAAFVMSTDPAYEVVDKKRCELVMKEIKFQVTMLNDKALLDRFGGMEPADALVTGSVRRLASKVKITVKAIAVPEATIKSMQMVSLPLTPDLAALFGESFYLPPVVGKRAQELKAMPPAKARQAMQAEAVKQAIDPGEEHPLADTFADLPYSIRVFVDGKQLPWHKKGRELVVAAPLGKPYQIRLTNNSKQSVAVGLYVDGLNTIGGKRELPSKGLKWVIKPETEVSIRGIQKGTKIAREFVFTKASESLAARKNYLDEVGLITAVFFRESQTKSPPPTKSMNPDDGNLHLTRGLTGTGEGEELESLVKRVKLTYDKVPAAVLSIHYDSPAAVKDLEVIE